MSLTRRQFNASLTLAAATLTGRSAFGQPTTTSVPDQSWLLFTKSADFEHDVVKRRDDGPNILARNLGPLFEKHGVVLTASKNGAHFEPDRIDRFGGFVFYTTGDLTLRGKDDQPPVSEAGKGALLAAVAAGKPFIGLHCASDTFHSADPATPSDFTRMLGGEFESHGEQQPAVARIVDKNFPGIGEQADWSLVEEWYALKNLAADIRPIHVLETGGMQGDMYQREPFPITWTRTHGKGRVFYTAIGHREDVIASKAYQSLIGGAIDWCRAGAK